SGTGFGRSISCNTSTPPGCVKAIARITQISHEYRLRQIKSKRTKRVGSVVRTGESKPSNAIRSVGYVGWHALTQHQREGRERRSRALPHALRSIQGIRRSAASQSSEPPNNAKV